MSIMQSVMEGAAPWPTKPDIAEAMRELQEADQAVEAYRAVNRWPVVDPRGDALDAALDEARRLFRSACEHHNIDRVAFAAAAVF